MLIDVLVATAHPSFSADISGSGHLEIRSAGLLLVVLELELEVTKSHPGKIELKILDSISHRCELPKVSRRAEHDNVHLQLLGLKHEVL